jgi:hypothetical protein
LLDVAAVKQAPPGCGEALAWPLEPFVQAVGNHELRPRSVMGAQEGQQGECVLLVQQGGHFLDWEIRAVLAESVLAAFRVAPGILSDVHDLGILHRRLIIGVHSPRKCQQLVEIGANMGSPHASAPQLAIARSGANLGGLLDDTLFDVLP